VRLQELSERELQLQGRRAREGGRVLLWTDLHVRTDVRMPELVRLCGDQGQVSATGAQGVQRC